MCCVCLVVVLVEPKNALNDFNLCVFVYECAFCHFVVWVGAFYVDL